MNAASRRATALLWAALCHGTFAVGVSWMLLALYGGLECGLGRLHGAPAVLADGLLLLSFPALHSLLLSERGRRLLAVPVPRALAGALAPTVFATVAGLQLIAVFGLWSPSHVIWWQPEGAAAAGMRALYAGSWLFLVKALRDGGLGLQTGWIGWRAAWDGRRPEFGSMPERGTFRLCRQPIYLGFALTLWTGPVWTPDHLGLALAWTAYCALGPLHKERRFARRYGERFAAYRARVPYMIPSLIQSPMGPKS